MQAHVEGVDARARRVDQAAALGGLCLTLFALEPDIHAHPQLVLLGVTGVVGTGVLRGLARVFGSFDRSD